MLRGIVLPIIIFEKTGFIPFFSSKKYPHRIALAEISLNRSPDPELRRRWER